MKLSNWLQLALLILLIGIGLLTTIRDKKLLEECSITANATVIDKYKERKKGYSIKYRYKIENKFYTTSEALTKKIEVDSLFIGNTITINVSCENHDISKMIK